MPSPLLLLRLNYYCCSCWFWIPCVSNLTANSPEQSTPVISRAWQNLHTISSALRCQFQDRNPGLDTALLGKPTFPTWYTNLSHGRRRTDWGGTDEHVQYDSRCLTQYYASRGFLNPEGTKYANGHCRSNQRSSPWAVTASKEQNGRWWQQQALASWGTLVRCWSYPTCGTEPGEFTCLAITAQQTLTWRHCTSSWQN